MRKKSKLTYGVIGLGRFGMALAVTLAESDNDVIVMDREESSIREMRNYTDYAFVTRRGRLLYAVTAGVITAAIRIFSIYPEGICFGILTANCLAGGLSLLNKRHVYGTRKV